MTGTFWQATQPVSLATQIKATGESLTAYLRGDGTWSTPAGTSGASVFVQDTNPGMTNPGLWIDTSGGNLTFWIEDGL